MKDYFHRMAAPSLSRRSCMERWHNTHTHTHTHAHKALARGVETFGYGYLVAEDKLVRLFFDADLLYRRKKRLWLLVASFE